MLNLYWKSAGETRTLIEKPFASEMDLEKYIYANQDILGDVSIVYRQIRTGNKQGIPDMLGVDQDARICLIELKNVVAGEDILPQALGYAIWAETNPDSIKAIWLESKTRPTEIEIDWDNLDIRVILIAPSFKSTVPRMATKMGYSIDLVQVRRYCFESEEFLLVEFLEEKPQPKPGVTKAKGDWNWEFYASEHGAEATAQFRKTVEAIDALCKKHGWDLPYNINKGYTGFKRGKKIAFAVVWRATKSWYLFFKVPRDMADSFSGKHWKVRTFDTAFNQAIFEPLHPEEPDISELEPLFVAAYSQISGKS